MYHADAHGLTASEKQTDRLKDRQTNRLKDRKTDRHT